VSRLASRLASLLKYNAASNFGGKSLLERNAYA